MPSSLPLSSQVGASEAALLGKLGIKPFKYGLEIVRVFENGSLFDPAVLSITDEDLMASAGAAIANIAALSLAIDIPTMASIPHSVINGYKNVLAVALETGVLFPKAEKVGVAWGREDWPWGDRQEGKGQEATWKVMSPVEFRYVCMDVCFPSMVTWSDLAGAHPLLPCPSSCQLHSMLTRN
jgi:hypothetical protein